ncbi:MAG: helix-turn-helix transcriptional regulator [Alteromonadales bacterium]|nr:helix-turn-helix transcriptional regulator [Alteromonadales bacterium]
MAKIDSYKLQNWTVLGHTRFTPPFKVSDSLINEARIVHVVNGRSRLYSANQFHDLSSGDTLIMKSDNFVNSWSANKDESETEVIVFQLTSDLIYHLYGTEVPEWFSHDNNLSVNPVLMINQNQLIDSYFALLQQYLNNPEQISSEVVQIKVRELIALIIQSDSTGETKTLFGELFNANEYNFQEVIQKNLFENLKLEDLAFLTGMSLSSFKRKFATIFGTSPTKYIVSKRLEEAKVLLNTTDTSISNIAYDCGFSDLAYFSKTFKNYYNYSPSEHRKQS